MPTTWHHNAPKQGTHPENKARTTGRTGTTNSAGATKPFGRQAGRSGGTELDKIPHWSEKWGTHLRAETRHSADWSGTKRMEMLAVAERGMTENRVGPKR